MDRPFWGWGVDPETDNYPWTRVAWNLLWFGPLMVFRGAFCVCVGLAHGYEEMSRAWELTQ